MTIAVSIGAASLLGGMSAFAAMPDPAIGKWYGTAGGPEIQSGFGLEIRADDPRDGRILWRTDVYGAPWGKPLLTEKFVYDGTSAIVPYMTRHTGGLVALDRKTGKLAWRFPLPNPSGTLHYGFAGSPARAGDSLVIGGMDGALYAFPIR